MFKLYMFQLNEDESLNLVSDSLLRAQWILKQRTGSSNYSRLKIVTLNREQFQRLCRLKGLV